MGRLFIIGIGLGVLLLAGAGAKAAEPARIEPFRLPDQEGKLTAVAPSDHNTLLITHRGDW